MTTEQPRVAATVRLRPSEDVALVVRWCRIQPESVRRGYGQWLGIQMAATWLLLGDGSQPPMGVPAGTVPTPETVRRAFDTPSTSLGPEFAAGIREVLGWALYLTEQLPTIEEIVSRQQLAEQAVAARTPRLRERAEIQAALEEYTSEPGWTFDPGADETAAALSWLAGQGWCPVLGVDIPTVHGIRDVEHALLAVRSQIKASAAGGASAEQEATVSAMQWAISLRDSPRPDRYRPQRH